MKIKEFFKKHKNLWLSIFDILLTILVFFLGIFLGYSVKDDYSASAEEYNPTPPYEYHYRMPIFFTNIVGFRPADGNVSIPIQNTFYSDELDESLPFTTDITYASGYFGLSQSFGYLGFIDDYLTYTSILNISSTSGNGFMLVAEDFWFSPDYFFDLSAQQYGVSLNLSAHYVINYYNQDFNEELVSFDNSGTIHHIDELIDDNINSATPIFYIRRLAITVNNVSISTLRLIFDFNGFDNNMYVGIVRDGVEYSNATVEIQRVDWFGSTVDSVNRFLHIEIIPSYTTSGGTTIPAFTLGNILAFCVIIPLIVAVLKLWLGG